MEVLFVLVSLVTFIVFILCAVSIIGFLWDRPIKSATLFILISIGIYALTINLSGITGALLLFIAFIYIPIMSVSSPRPKKFTNTQKLDKAIAKACAELDYLEEQHRRYERRMGGIADVDNDGLGPLSDSACFARLELQIQNKNNEIIRLTNQRNKFRN